MKRKITELEQKLLDKGFRLTQKTYGGKHSQFVHEYIYVGEIVKDNEKERIEERVFCEVHLNQKKNHINCVYFENLTSYFSLVDLPLMENYLDLIRYATNEIMRLENNE